MNVRETDEILEIFLQEMRHRLGNHLQQVILFGSRARGDFTSDSDYDCLALVDDISPAIENIINEISGELLYQHNAVFSIFPVAEKKYRQQKFDPFFMNIRQEGIVL